MTVRPLATRQFEEGRAVLRFERHLDHPPEKAWRALTEPSELAHWFPAMVELELRPGAPVRFFQEEADIGETTGEVLEVDPPKLFAFDWNGDVLRWELVPDGDGCRLLFSHTLSGNELWGDEKFAAQHAAGWDQCLDLLIASIDGGAADNSMDAWFVRNEEYVEAYGLAEGEVVEDGDGQVVRFERILVQSPEAAWAALTGSDTGLAAGCMPPAATTVDAVPAGPLTSVGPGQVLEYAWHHESKPAGSVRWSVSGREYACRLVLTQTVPTELAALQASMLAAWQVHLERFIAWLHDVERPWPDGRVAALRTMYANRI